MDTLARLAGDHGLIDQVNVSPDGLHERYLYSPDMVFRYAFGRWWGDTDLATSAIWVLLNPATGDTEQRHRPTLQRCIAWSKAAGYTGLAIVNLFAFRDTNPRNLRTVADAVGPANDEVLRVITKAGAQTIAAWGGHGRLRGRSAQVGPLLDSPMCLGITRRGEPRHPLYTPADTQLVPWFPMRPDFDPQSEEWTAALVHAPAAAVKRLRAAIDVVKGLSEKGSPAVRWSLPRPRGDGSTANPLVLPYPQYDEGVTQLIAALEEVNAQPAAFDWMRWDGSRRYPGGHGLAHAPVADAMRMVTVIIRGERFCDGTIATAIEDGSLLASAERIMTALDEHLNKADDKAP